MKEIGIEYRGKRSPWTYENPHLSVGKATFAKGKTTWLPAPDAMLILRNQDPRCFKKVGERGDVMMKAPPDIDPMAAKISSAFTDEGLEGENEQEQDPNPIILNKDGSPRKKPGRKSKKDNE